MRDIAMGGYDDDATSTRVLWSTAMLDRRAHLDARWTWEYDIGPGHISVASMPIPGDERAQASIESYDLARLQAAWDTWHAIIDDPATAPDAVLHWLAEVTPGRTETTETQEET